MNRIGLKRKIMTKFYSLIQETEKLLQRKIAIEKERELSEDEEKKYKHTETVYNFQLDRYEERIMKMIRANNDDLLWILQYQ